MKKLLMAEAILLASVLTLTACQHTQSSQASYTVEAEIGFTNIGAQAFEREEAAFYSGGAAIKLPGSAPIGATGIVEYDLSGSVPGGVYRLSIHYNDENDGHAPVTITLDQQKFAFEMNEATPSGFEAKENQRSRLFEDVVVGENAILRIEGSVDRYESEHKELVRLDAFVFAPI